MEFKHEPIMLETCIEHLNIKKEGIYVDGTVGGAGHAFHILSKLDEGLLIGIDQDINALNAAEKRLSTVEGKGSFRLVKSNFKNINKILEENDILGIDGILLDLGVSSHQLDEGIRGFSYNQNARLDMRMSDETELDAQYIVNHYSQDDLNRIIKAYGEEKWAARIAEFIVKDRQQKEIETTWELVDIIKKAIPAAARRDGPHPAKRTFQAIRIEVNKELEVLKQALVDAMEVMNPGGRICVITFHSLEDRIVKEFFNEQADPCHCPKSFPVCVCGKKPRIKIITRKPIVPDSEELERNSRSRSAKLRVAEKI